MDKDSPENLSTSVGRHIPTKLTKRSVGNQRAGQSPIISPVSAKDYMGRNTFVRPGNHQGGLARPTEHVATRSVRHSDISSGQLTTQQKLKELIEMGYEKDIRALRTSLTDDQIVEALSDHL